MLTTKIHEIPGYETVLEGACPETGLKAFIAIHDTTLGPALGGVRFYPYASEEEALKDVLNLSKAMTYKSAVIKDGLGGGKSVIIGDPKKIKTDKLLLSFGKMLNELKGRYIAAEDVGMSVEDLMTIGKASPYVAGLATEASSSDPSRFTAHGIKRGIEAVAETLWKTPSVKNKRVIVQGLGNVGFKVAELLFWDNAELLVADPDPEKTKKACHDMGAKSLPLDKVFSTPCDLVVPCALGAVLNKDSIKTLECEAVAGAANNQLNTQDDGKRLFDKGILYAPDFVINAGGIINAATEFDPEGYNAVASRNRTENIYTTLLEIFALSKKENIPTHLVANAIAERHIREGIGRRVEPINFNMLSSSP